MGNLLPRRSSILLLALLLSGGCTGVTQMQRQYQAGDESQLDRLIEIAGRYDYPYGTRRKATRALGEIGNRKAVPVLSRLLLEYEQRTTLKQEALVALGRIGDSTAVEPIGRMLDMHLNENNADLRLAAVEVLGQLGGAEAAEILVNALRYYDLVMLRDEQMTMRGIFSGEKQVNPYAPQRPTPQDSVALRPPQLRGPLPDEGGQIVGMFGTPLETYQPPEDPTPEERRMAHQALVRIGEEAVPVVEGYLVDRQTTHTLLRELTQIVVEIRQPQAPNADQGSAEQPR